MVIGAKHIEWNAAKQQEGVDILSGERGMIVTPTKVGYIIMTSDFVGLRRTFSAKQRALNKPGVVLCSSMQQRRLLYQMNNEVDALYQKACDEDILLGCILPSKEGSTNYIPADGSKELMMDRRRTSCFVIKFGVPSEIVAHELWAKHKKLVFASSANPSGKGNPGRISGIGERICGEAD